MDRNKLISEMQEERGYLCVGLDSDRLRLPHTCHRQVRVWWRFNKADIQIPLPLCKWHISPIFAFYEALGSQGIEALEHTVAYLRSTYPRVYDYPSIPSMEISAILRHSMLRAAFEGDGGGYVTVALYGCR